MNIVLLILTLLAPTNLEEKTLTFVMRETVTTMRNITRYGWEFESEALVTRWTLKIQAKRGLAEEIDYERYYLAEQQVVNLYHFRDDLVWRYNVISKELEARGVNIPGLPRRIILEAEGWGCLFQYI